MVWLRKKEKISGQRFWLSRGPVYQREPLRIVFIKLETSRSLKAGILCILRNKPEDQGRQWQADCPV